MHANKAHSLRSEAHDFLRRCESALEVARQTGSAAWKVEALEEAVQDAKDAVADWDHVLGG